MAKTLLKYADTKNQKMPTSFFYYLEEPADERETMGRLEQKGFDIIGETIISSVERLLVYEQTRDPSYKGTHVHVRMDENQQGITFIEIDGNEEKVRPFLAEQARMGGYRQLA